MAVRVFLLDDHQVVREGVRRLLESSGQIRVVREAESVAQALAGLGELVADVAVLDVRLPDGSGLELCRELRSAHPETGCLILTAYPDDEALAQAILAGAAGYVLKQIRGDQLIAAVRAVARGENLINPETRTRVLTKLRQTQREAAAREPLSAREEEILELIATGRTNRQIAEQLFLAEKTVKNYVSNLLAKLGMVRRSEAAAYAARLAERRAQQRTG